MKAPTGFVLILSFAFANSFYISTDESSKEKIVNGEAVKITDVPYYAAFIYNNVFNCGLAIISNTWLVSAAHCFVGKWNVEKYGKIRIGISERSQGESLNIQKVIIHPAYNIVNQDNDIALIKLEEPIEFNEKQKAIVIVEANEIPKKGQMMQITGFGKTDVNSIVASEILMTAFVKVLSDSACEKAYRYDEDPVTDNMFCAESLKSDACQGDSGGPAVINGKLAGVVSSGTECATGTYPGVYTKLHKYYDWIVKETNTQ